MISFLLGSGFSIPERLPSVTQLNTRLSRIRADELYIGDDQTAFFLNGQPDINSWDRNEEKVFVQDFLDFYQRQLTSQGQSFHYETFVDYYSSYLFDEAHRQEIEGFYSELLLKYPINLSTARDCHNAMLDFGRTFNQLIASKLRRDKYLNEYTTSAYPPYDGFIGLLSHCLKDHEVKVHTLNHDLFFDWLGKHHQHLFGHYCDGFELDGSPFYGYYTQTFPSSMTPREVINISLRVKMARFTGKFDKRLCLFKLHGSIDNTVVYTPPPQQKARVQRIYGVDRLGMEIADPRTQLPTFIAVHDQVPPDYLSGTTNKMRYYSDDPHYTPLFDHFAANLQQSDHVVIIGYGFKDPGINDYLEKHFFTSGKTVVVVDPGHLPEPVASLPQLQHLQKGVDQVSLPEYLQHITL